ncbi:hypothetical protein RF11_11833 [Thelohanellus kitauei]|uniref:Uncharacterized protein n=1 Tax=Thelohanellus kitauei TaxID=669202 RepID=A0A0C2MGD0_THEKT|nr:hypothetical protein RF11_11833 [Thelohanellus kitauei]
MRSDFIIDRYVNAAECYFKTNNVRAYECYNRAVDVDVKKQKINKAIQKCFQYGYLLFVEFKEKGLFEKLYRKGEDLRLLHDLKHSCVITKFDVPEIDENDDEIDESSEEELHQAVSDAVDLRKKFQVEELVNRKRVITHESICRNCIQARADLDEFIKEEKSRKVETTKSNYSLTDYW